MDGIAALASTPGKDVLDRLTNLEKENGSLRSSMFEHFYEIFLK